MNKNEIGKMLKRFEIGFAIFSLGSLVSYLTYCFGHDEGYDKGYDKGHGDGCRDGINRAFTMCEDYKGFTEDEINTLLREHCHEYSLKWIGD